RRSNAATSPPPSAGAPARRRLRDDWRSRSRSRPPLRRRLPKRASSTAACRPARARDDGGAMDTSGLPDDLDVALGFFHATMFSLPLWGLLLTLWYLLASHAGYS